MHAPRILLTGFEPFATLERNASADIVAGLTDRIGRADGVAYVACEVLPVVYDVARDRLREAIDRHQPDILVCHGVHRGESIRLERTARNEDNAASPDNIGVTRTGQPIDPDGPAQIATRLPLAEMEQVLAAAGLPVWPSDSAGGYLCNHVFYAAMRWATDAASSHRLAGFVHVPPLQDGTLSLADCIAGLYAALPAIVAAWNNHRVAGGPGTP